MLGIALTFPIRPGKVEAWRRFCQELSGSRLQAYEASRRRLGITLEQMALVDTKFGATATTTIEAHDVNRALGQIIASDLAFEHWYRERILELHGVDLAGYEYRPQNGASPPTLEIVFEWVGH